MEYINFLIAAQQVLSSVKASQTHLAEEQAPAHDAYRRVLKRLPPDSRTLWQEVEPLVERVTGVLIIDYTMLDKPYATQKTALVTRHWSGKRGGVVQGINLISLV
jgi:putative transposase